MKPKTAQTFETHGQPPRHAAVVGCLVTLLITAALTTIAIHLVTHDLFYDETMHIRYVWRIANGAVPYKDFWCHYPALVYLLSAPVLRALPESAFNVFVMRAMSLPIVAALAALFAYHSRRVCKSWLPGFAMLCAVVTTPPLARFLVEYSTDHLACLAAVAALVLGIRPRTPRALYAAIVCAVLSFVAMPKYTYMLGFGLLGGFVSLCATLPTRRAWLVLFARCAGVAIVTLAAIALVLSMTGTSRYDYYLFAFAMQARYSVAVRTDWLFTALFRFLINFPVPGLAIAAGLLSWAWYARRLRLRQCWGELGMLAGVLLFTLVTPHRYEQYLWPAVVCLLLFTPYIVTVPFVPRADVAVSAVAAVCCIVVLYQAWQARDDFGRTPSCSRGFVVHGYTLPAWRHLHLLQQLLDIIPSNETVVAAWHHHPLFRTDLTYVTQDERPSKQDFLPASDPRRRAFEPQTLVQALRQRPPAYISLYQSTVNQPPGWFEALTNFLHAPSVPYADIASPYGPMFIRRDLLQSVARP